MENHFINRTIEQFPHAETLQITLFFQTKSL